MFKIAICEDDPAQRDSVSRMIQKILNAEQHKISQFESGEDLLLFSEKFHIYFLDIQLKKHSGIEVAKKIRNFNEEAVIIFTTAHKGYVFDAFDVRAFHYLLKPLEEQKLTEVLLSALTGFKKNDPFIIARTLWKSSKILMKDILYIEAEQRKLKVHTPYDVIEYYYKISEIEKELTGHDFFRCHRSYIVNLKYVQGYDSKSITLKNGETIYLSKYKSSDFSREFMYYLKNKEC